MILINYLIKIRLESIYTQYMIRQYSTLVIMRKLTERKIKQPRFISLYAGNSNDKNLIINSWLRIIASHKHIAQKKNPYLYWKL